MTILWSQPYFFLLLCTGLYYTLRTSRLLSEVQHRNIYNAFLWEQCSSGERRAVLLALVRTVPGSVSTLSWWMLLAMIHLGGAGCLFWYAVFSLLWVRPLGALSTLWAYYRAPDEVGIRFPQLFSRARTRKYLPPAPRRAGLLGLVQLGVLCCSLCPAGLLLPRSLDAPGPRTAIFCLLAAAAVRLFLPTRRQTAWSVASLLFLAVLAAALLCNLANLIPAVQLVVLDAFQFSPFLLALSGAGFQLALRSGGQLAVGTAGLTLPSDGGMPELPHPICCGLRTQLQALLSLILHLLLGLLFLCTQLAPQKSAWFQILLWGFLCLFGVERFVQALRRLPCASRWTRPAAGLLCPLAWLLLDRLGGSLFQSVFWGLFWAGSLGTVWLLLSGSGWYFALLEDYRDAFLWHVQPHPRISRRHRPPPE